LVNGHHTQLLLCPNGLFRCGALNGVELLIKHSVAATAMDEPGVDCVFLHCPSAAVTVKVKGIKPLPSLASNNGSWLLLRPVVRIQGQLIASLDALAASSTPSAAKVVEALNPNTAFDRIIQLPAIGDPSINRGFDGSAGVLEVTIPASQWFKEGVWSVSAELSLMTETPALLTIPQAGVYEKGDFTQGADVIGERKYMPAVLMEDVKVGIQKGKTPIYLRKLELPSIVQVRVGV
jgi:hypothetical protein